MNGELQAGEHHFVRCSRQKPRDWVCGASQKRVLSIMQRIHSWQNIGAVSDRRGEMRSEMSSVYVTLNFVV